MVRLLQETKNVPAQLLNPTPSVCRTVLASSIQGVQEKKGGSPFLSPCTQILR